jgi:hypothetical protein
MVLRGLYQSSRTNENLPGAVPTQVIGINSGIALTQVRPWPTHLAESFF